MTPDQAAQEYWELIGPITETTPLLSRFERAEKKLKTHMAERKLATFKGIKLESFSRGRRLSMDILVDKVGADTVEACKEEQVAHRLLPWRRPKTVKPAA
jgi:hypothetical protein